ncbi:serine hydrolase [Streptomyces tsukubensis]|uniref:Beta-lactamase-related domain-containing protein n=1 Tax=Streptomyces tsukubensis TaxID=83656 RepID=A0A1V4A665_9ACTN|nr:serine hydrolase [Streptomyces tsukubensis]OON76422.1 hypothetical protein B1H18_21025 [Streptomyces tsukubensis]QFR96002.1 hypothetical protein GBW32_26825 [Streptomyces tsukubensis]
MTGHRHEAEVERRVLGPAGLRYSYFPDADTDIRGPHNDGYQEFPKAGGEVELRDVTRWSQTESWAAGHLTSTTTDLERSLHRLFRGRIVRGPALEEMFTMPRRPAHPDEAVPTFGSGWPGQYSAGRSVEHSQAIAFWGKSGSRYGYTTAVGATRDPPRSLVYSVNATDAKGRDLNRTA